MAVTLFENRFKHCGFLKVRLNNVGVLQVANDVVDVVAAGVTAREFFLVLAPEVRPFLFVGVFGSSDARETDHCKRLQQERFGEQFPFLVEHADNGGFEGESEGFGLARLEDAAGVVAEEPLDEV